MIPKYVGASEPLSYVFINGLQAKRYSKMPKKKIYHTTCMLRDSDA